METRPSWSAPRLVLVTGLLVHGAPTDARVESRRFEQSLREGYEQLLDGRGAPISPETRVRRFLESAEKVFSESPPASRELSHLRRLAAQQLEGLPRRAPLADGDEHGRAWLIAGASASMEKGGSRVGGAAFWHQTQHLYDRQASYMRPPRMEGGILRTSLDGERRAWKAGCVFWEAGREPVAGAREPACLGRFPADFYCERSHAVEFVVFIAERLKQLGRSRADAAKGESALEQALSGYCAEAERSERGNPLSLEGFHFEWGLETCLERALGAVRAPGWKSTLELCPAAGKTGPDARLAAETISDWR